MVFCFLAKQKATSPNDFLRLVEEHQEPASKPLTKKKKKKPASRQPKSSTSSKTVEPKLVDNVAQVKPPAPKQTEPEPQDCSTDDPREFVTVSRKSKKSQLPKVEVVPKDGTGHAISFCTFAEHRGPIPWKLATFLVADQCLPIGESFIKATIAVHQFLAKPWANEGVMSSERDCLTKMFAEGSILGRLERQLFSDRPRTDKWAVKYGPDSVYVLTATFLLQHSFGAALSFLQWLGLGTFHAASSGPLNNGCGIPAQLAKELFASMRLDQLELAIGYRFQRKQLLGRCK